MDRINFVVHEELEELLTLASLDIHKARAIYEAGFTSCCAIIHPKPIPKLEVTVKIRKV